MSLLQLPAVDRGLRRQKDAEVNVAASLGRNLARCRKRAGLSQEELAVRASLHRTAVGQIERGERIARADTLLKLAGSLGISPGEFFAGLTWTPGGTTIGQFGAGEEPAGDPESN
jgi:transcriptional regulator with XRE-family HTH domain